MKRWYLLLLFLVTFMFIPAYGLTYQDEQIDQAVIRIDDDVGMTAVNITILSREIQAPQVCNEVMLPLILLNLDQVTISGLETPGYIITPGMYTSSKNLNNILNNNRNAKAKAFCQNHFHRQGIRSLTDFK